MHKYIANSIILLMSARIMFVLGAVLSLQIFLWIVMEIDVWLFADPDAKINNMSVRLLPVAGLIVLFFGVAIQLWYFYSRAEIHSADDA